ncbi:PREDICTED: F-box/kelch-repeat protein At3g23880-like [Ipomoea nil]|uniref:F-box/kelch-repeat protein At3g23880-like n=1 Tax=Ipomoea nil TaxID=35883 RepID=UPI00090092B2|nr:PREDICTED: F-box/kelch-repeat protein At3g23880-like [Ipomoea nil]
MDMRKLPQDAIEEILSRLPLKPLGRCKCVSKSWHNLISSRNFVKKHLDRTLSNPTDNPFRILTYWCYESLDYESPSALQSTSDSDDVLVDLDDPLGPEDPCIDRHVIGSCHGLVALLYQYDGLERIILWNPCIRSARELPGPPPNPPHANPAAFYGFGYDASIDDYKVVKAVRSKSTNETTAYVFCIYGADSWRTINGPDKSIVVVHETESCYFHGKMGSSLHGGLHWLADRGVNGGGLILRLDLTAETFSELPQPTTGDPNTTFEVLWVLKDRLGLLSTPTAIDCNIEFWEMEEYGIGTSWKKLFSTGESLEFGEYVAPLCVARNGDLIIEIDGWFTVRYNVGEKTFEYLKCNHPDMHRCSVYMQTMVSPYKIPKKTIGYVNEGRVCKKKRSTRAVKKSKDWNDDVRRNS